MATLLRDGCSFQMGTDDGFIGECTQILAWSNDAGVFVDQGEVIDLEGSQGVYDG